MQCSGLWRLYNPEIYACPLSKHRELIEIANGYVTGIDKVVVFVQLHSIEIICNNIIIYNLHSKIYLARLLTWLNVGKTILGKVLFLAPCFTYVMHSTREPLKSKTHFHDFLHHFRLTVYSSLNPPGAPFIVFMCLSRSRIGRRVRLWIFSYAEFSFLAVVAEGFVLPFEVDSFERAGFALRKTSLSK